MSDDVPFAVSVLGRVDASGREPGTGAGLTPGDQKWLLNLVAAGHLGIAGGTATTRMALSRLSRKLPHGAIPTAQAGTYRLALDPDDVDAWCLLTRARSQQWEGLGSDQLMHLLRRRTEIAELKDDLDLNVFATRIEAAQRALLCDLDERRCDLLDDGQYVELAQDHLAFDPFNERLVLTVARRLASAGRRVEAIRLLGEVFREFRGDGHVLGPAVTQLHHTLLEGGTARSGALPSPIGELPRPLAEQLVGRRVGPDTPLEVLRNVLDRSEARLETVVVSGEPAAGKTRLCAEAATWAHAKGYAVRYTRPSGDGTDAAMGAFLRILLSLRRAMGGIMRSDGDQASRRAQLWLALDDAIDDAAAGRPLLLVVDDAQWLDSYSLEAIAHLAGFLAETRLVLLVAGRDADGPWRILRARLQMSAAHVIELGPLDRPAMFDLVGERRPDLSLPVTHAVTDELMRATGGLPGVATLLLGSLDADGLATARPGRSAVEDHLVAAIRSVPGRAPFVAMVGAVIGEELSIDELIDISEEQRDVVVPSAEQLVEHGFWVHRPGGRYGIRHALVRSASLASWPTIDVCHAHVRAASYFASDLHRRAWHEGQAVPHVRAEQAMTTLLESARRLNQHGLYREAATRFRAASQLAPSGSLDARDAAAYSRSLDLSGAHEAAERVRRPAFERALGRGAHAAALDVAVSGLPEAEPIDGDPIIVADLLALDPSRLSRDERWAHAHHLARQLTIVGMLTEASVWADRCARYSSTPAERVAAAIVQRFAQSATSTPATRVATLATASDDLRQIEPPQLASYLVLLSIDQYEAGESRLASATLDRLRALDLEIPPLRRWHLMLLDAMLATDAGESTRARTLRDAARLHGRRCAFAEHENAHLAAEFVDLWLRRSTDFLAAEVDGGALDPSHSVLTRAGAAIVLDAVGNREPAIRHAEDVAEAVLASPVSQGCAALALVAAVLAHSRRRSLRDESRRLLSQHGDAMLVIGAGAASLGPVARYVALLTDDPGARREHQLAACDLADRSGSALWRIVTRRDLLDAGHSDGHLEQDAAHIADSAGLQELLAHTT